MAHGGSNAAVSGEVRGSHAEGREDSPTRSRKSRSLANPRRAGKAGPPNHEPGRSGKGNRGAPGKNPRVTESQKPRPGESQHRQAAPAETERREGSEASKAMERRGGEGEGG